jgi:hypothetical protein
VIEVQPLGLSLQNSKYSKNIRITLHKTIITSPAFLYGWEFGMHSTGNEKKNRRLKKVGGRNLLREIF